MGNLRVDGTGTGYTLVSNLFIDQYMITAGSSHLKTYLLLLRLYGDPHSEITIQGMADALECIESDVIRSLKYWEKKGLIRLSLEQDGRTIAGIYLQDPGMRGAGKDSAVSEAAMGKAPQEKWTGLHPEQEESGTGIRADISDIEAKQKPEALVEEEPLPDRNIDFRAISADENYSRLLFVAEQYMGNPLSRTDCEIFAWMYDKLKMDAGLLEYLVEYCVTNGHRSTRYMEAVAIDWHRKKIFSVDQARIYTPLHDKNIYAVMKALGLQGRQPAPGEQQIIDGWFRKYGFSQDLVVEACNRTMVSIHEPNLKYVESILSRWKDAGVSSLEQLQALDDEFQKKKSDKKEAGGSTKKEHKKNGASGKKAGAQFHNFDQRTYDFDTLLKELYPDS